MVLFYKTSEYIINQQQVIQGISTIYRYLYTFPKPFFNMFFIHLCVSILTEISAQNIYNSLNLKLKCTK